MKPSKFEIRSREHPPILNMAPEPFRLWDFFIDGVSLANQVGVGALNGLTSLEYLQFKNSEWVLQEFLGHVTPSNQFRTGRLVLYCCHCGCDYCGVISCILQKNNRVITWSNIRQEDDFELSNESFQSLPESFHFHFSDYRKEILRVSESLQTLVPQTPSEK